jgi:hypothetical protein
MRQIAASMDAMDAMIGAPADAALHAPDRQRDRELCARFPAPGLRQVLRRQHVRGGLDDVGGVGEPARPGPPAGQEAVARADHPVAGDLDQAPQVRPGQRVTPHVDVHRRRDHEPGAAQRMRRVASRSFTARSLGHAASLPRPAAWT